MQVWMLKAVGHPTRLAFAARRAISILAQEESSQPQRQLLFADAPRAVEEQARWQRALCDGGA